MKPPSFSGRTVDVVEYDRWDEVIDEARGMTITFTDGSSIDIGPTGWEAEGITIQETTP